MPTSVGTPSARSQQPSESEPEPTPGETGPEPTPGADEPQPTPDATEPGAPLPPTAPTFTIRHSCDELAFGIGNPENSEYGTITSLFTPNIGDPQTLTVAPGENGTVSFPASEGLTVTPSMTGPGSGMRTAFAAAETPIAWEQPEDCDSGSGGGLPVTGAAALLAAGAALFVIAGRRRIRFTA